MIFHTSGPEETQAVAQKLAALLRPGDLIAYRGGMGVGKTTFTAGLARGLGSTAWVSSPTFALVHQYQGKIPLCHFDLFRITSLEDLYSTGFSITWRAGLFWRWSGAKTWRRSFRSPISPLRSPWGRGSSGPSP